MHKQMEYLISFLISILANNVPAIKELLEKNQSLNDAIDDAYQKALERWCINDSIRESIGDKYNSIDNLKEVFENTSKLSVDEQKLIALWAEELRNDSKTYNLILELKIDSLSSLIDDIRQRLDLNCVFLPEEIKNRNRMMLANVHDCIVANGKEWAIDRKQTLKDINESFTQYKCVVLDGEGGSGKSAIIKKFMAEKQVPIIYFKADQFQCPDINSLFHYERNYDTATVKEFFSKDEEKFIVIDSSEDLFRLQDKTNFRLFMDSFGNCGWKFLLAVRTAEAMFLKSYIEPILKAPSHTIQVKTLSNEGLHSLLNECKLPIPSNRHLRERLTNLFYLSQYVSIKGQSDSTLSVFKETIWDKKVKGTDFETRARQESREHNLLLLVKEYNKVGRSIISPEGLPLDYTSIDGLEKDEVITNIPHLGYSFAHDIFIDWAEEFLISRKWYEANHNANILMKHLGLDIVTRNAFSRWFEGKVEAHNDCVKDFVKISIDNDIEAEWMSSVIATVFKFQDSSESFVQVYEPKLLENKGSLFFKVLRILCVQCVIIDRYVTSNGKQYPIMKPVGYGWEIMASLLIRSNNIDRESHHDLIHKFLHDFSNKTDADKKLSHDVGMSVLQPYIDAMEDNDYYLLNAKELCTSICDYSLYITNELAEIINKVVENKWVKHGNPYYDLMSYIVKADDSKYSNYPLYRDCPDEVLRLMNLFWKRQVNTLDNRNEFAVASDEELEAWGLNCYTLISIDYFPASAYQTCILPMLGFHPLKTLDFIISLMNYCIEYYARSKWMGENCEDIIVKLTDGSKHHVYGTAACWCMVRGSSAPVTPYVLQSIHMALEKYLLDNCKNANNKKAIDNVRLYLNKILKESASVTLYAVVASVAKAYPQYFLDELLVVSSNLTLLSFDDDSTSRERFASSIDFAYRGRINMQKERKESNQVRNRHKRIGQVLLDIQYALDGKDPNDVESKQKLDKIYSVIDDLKSQLGKRNKTLNLKSIISELDYRSMTKKDVEVNGVQAVMLMQNLDEEQKEASNAMQKQQEKQTPLIAAINWIIAKWQDNKEVLKTNAYEKDPMKALEVAQNYMAIDKTDKKQHFLFLPGDRYIPFGVCSLMVQFYYDKLSEDDKKFCVNTVVSCLESPNFMHDSIFVKLSYALGVIEKLLAMRPDLTDNYADILIMYSTIKEKFQGENACNAVSNFIYTSHLWEKHREFMCHVVQKFLDNEQQIKDIIISRLYFHQVDYVAEIWVSESLLCLIPCHVGDERFDSLALNQIEKVSHIWDRENEYKNWFIGHKVESSTIIARYILSANDASIAKIISMFVPYLHYRDTEDIFHNLIMYALLDNSYDSFWKIWMMFYPYIVPPKDNPVYDEVFKSYLLNPNWFSVEWQDWFKFDDRGVAFYKRIADDRGKDSRTLCAITKSCVGMAKQFRSQLIPIIAKMVSSNTYNSVSDKDDVSATVFYLQNIISEEMANNGKRIKDDNTYKSHILSLLTFMEHNGSAWAFEIKREF